MVNGTELLEPLLDRQERGLVHQDLATSTGIRNGFIYIEREGGRVWRIRYDGIQLNITYTDQALKVL